jgi:hypothetical protein
MRKRCISFTRSRPPDGMRQRLKSGPLRNLSRPDSGMLVSETTVRTGSSGRGGLPSLLPLARATLSATIVSSDILARSCFASVANMEVITSLKGPVEFSHCSW